MHVLHLDDVRDERRDVIGLGEYEDDLNMVFLDDGGEEIFELVTSACVESDEWVVHDEHTRLREERLREFQFTELSAG